MRLIDADALEKEISVSHSMTDDCGIKIGYEVSMRLVEDAPTIDAVPVVRCKDCKNSEHWYRDRRRCFLWNEAGVSVFDDGFCNYGELKQ